MTIRSSNVAGHFARPVPHPKVAAPRARAARGPPRPGPPPLRHRISHVASLEKKAQMWGRIPTHPGRPVTTRRVRPRKPT